MAVIGIDLDIDELVLTKNRDFSWTFTNVNDSGIPTPFPAGSLYFEFDTSPVTTWEFDISGWAADLKVESTDVVEILNRTKWQLVFLPDGEAVGGEPVARGVVRVQQ